MGVKPGSVGDAIAVAKGQSQRSRTGGGRGRVEDDGHHIFRLRDVGPGGPFRRSYLIADNPPAHRRASVASERSSSHLELCYARHNDRHVRESFASAFDDVAGRNEKDSQACVCIVYRQHLIF